MTARTPRWAVCGALFAAALALTPAAAQDPAAGPLDALQRELEEIHAEAVPLLDELKSMQAEYVRTGDIKSIAAKREKLIEEISELRTRHAQLFEEFKSVKSQLYMQKVLLTISQMQNTGGAPNPQANIGRAMVYETFYRTAVDFRKEFDRTLGAEHAAFEETQRAVAQRKTMTVVGVLLACAVLAGLFTAFVYGKKGAGDPALITAYPTAPSAGPASGSPGLIGYSQGAVSGPAGSSVSGAVGAASGPAGPVSGPSSGPGQQAQALLGGNFRIEREIGRGGMGLVYEAVDLTLQRKVAIKKLRDEVLANKRELDLFLAEARLVASLKHRNLVEIHSIVREGDLLYLVFEFVAGKPLQQVLDEEDRQPHGRIKQILRQVADGLDYAHSRNVIHRDLKPSNIMVGDDGTVKIMDFGIAHQAKKTVATLTRADAWGTPPYMAPEQELGTISRESDLYALGACYYEMVTGRQPFEGPNFLAQKQEMIFQRPTRIVSSLPSEIDAVAEKALHSDPGKRFHSGSEFIAALDTVPA